MKVALKTKGRSTPVKGSLVRYHCAGDAKPFVYIVVGAELPTEIDDYTAVTECDVQPAEAFAGNKVIEAVLIKEGE